MKIGLCASLEYLQTAIDAGFDYIEPSVTSVAQMTPDEFDAALVQMDHAPIPASSFNVLFPRTIDLFRDDDDTITEYLTQALLCASELGAKHVVFGSGKARMRPESMSEGDAMAHLIRVTRLIAGVAEKYGIIIVIEPLNRSETNTINSVAEGAALVKAVNHPNVRLLADYYHMAAEGEDVSILTRVPIAHAHIATGEGRCYPTTDDPGVIAFLTALKQSGYAGGISVEGRSDDRAADGAASVRTIRAIWERI